MNIVGEMVPNRDLIVLNLRTGSGLLSKSARNNLYLPGLLIFLAEPLSKLFANSLTTVVVPTDWHLAIICAYMPNK